jgi:hypothetical protein
MNLKEGLMKIVTTLKEKFLGKVDELYIKLIVEQNENLTDDDEWERYSDTGSMEFDNTNTNKDTKLESAREIPLRNNHYASKTNYVGGQKYPPGPGNKQ